MGKHLTIIFVTTSGETAYTVKKSALSTAKASSLSSIVFLINVALVVSFFPYGCFFNYFYWMKFQGSLT